MIYQLIFILWMVAIVCVVSYNVGYSSRENSGE